MDLCRRSYILFFLFPPSLTRYHFVEDMFFSDSLRAQSEAELAGRKDKPNFVEYEFKEYEGAAQILRYAERESYYLCLL